MCGKMKEVFMQMHEENWKGTPEEYLHQYNEKEIQKKRDSKEIYYVLYDKNSDRRVIDFEGTYVECENYISNKKDSNKYGIIYDMDEDGNFSI